ncbi:response regulator transcription factor [Oceanirhabdus sp. W0125-5]|uniref:response regulator transcription factor n=1 Tax=Oceanirhabdus sp. W0125-5 TaxID=2999116 RepID=UPI0022F343A7|nr:response regulator transcription factor [Oceanirhabdus sp. W0125-5]WBW98628.1 response regulator transcription factor [Oceanirhabdus sp. W0125-5]
MYKIMIIEDDSMLSSLIMNHMKKYNFVVKEIEDFMNVQKQIETFEPHLILLDINLPYQDGYHICREIRTKSRIPVLMISARDTEMDQILAIELGADDYIIKPFKLEILMSKVKAILRRAYGEYSLIEEKVETEIQENGIQLNPNSFTANYNGKAVELSKNEFKLLKRLIDNIDKVVGREVLFNELWDESTFVEENTLSVNIARIRNRLKEIGIIDSIRAKRGVGYMFDSSSLEGASNE